MAYSYLQSYFSGMSKPSLFLNIIGLLLLIALPLYYYQILPEKIPSHYGFGGVPDAYSSKSSIWFLPILGICLFAFLSAVGHFTNKSKKKEKFPGEQAMAKSIMNWLSVIITYMFLNILWGTIQTAIGNQEGLSPHFTAASIIMPMVPILYFVYRGFTGSEN